MCICFFWMGLRNSYVDLLFFEDLGWFFWYMIGLKNFCKNVKLMGVRIIYVNFDLIR